MTDTLNTQLIQELASISGSPCISLYMPTHRSHPANEKDPIRFKNLCKELEDSLLLQYSASETKEHMKPFQKLADDADFWNCTTEGLAVLSSKGVFKTIGLQVPVNEFAVVADSFHTKPLRKYLQTVDRYQVLGISLHDLKLFEGNRHSIAEVKLPSSVSKTMEEALGYQLTESHSTVASYGGIGGESHTMHHGHGSKKDETEIDTERFFRISSERIYEHYSKPSGLPLILASLTEHQNLFHKVSDNPMLLSKGIEINYKGVTEEKLNTMAWEIMQPEYDRRLSAMAARFEQAKADGTGSDDIITVAGAAAAGRIDTLMLQSGCAVAGKITDMSTGEVKMGNLSNPDTDDVLDDIGELVTKMGGQVWVIPQENMPSKTGIAAIYRY